MQSLFFTPLQYQPYQFSTFGFDKLQNLGGDIPSEFDFLLRLLNQQYSTIGPIAREQYEEEANYVTEKHNYLALNMPWYSDFRIGVVTPEAEEFFTKNHVYQNWVAQYIRDNNATEQGFTYGYLIASLSTLVVLNDILGNEQSILLEQFLPKYKNDISGIEGFYQNQVDGNRIEIKMIGGYLFFQNQILKELSRDEYQGLFYSKIRFNRDEDNEIESLTIVNMNSNNTVLKIE